MRKARWRSLKTAHRSVQDVGREIFPTRQSENREDGWSEGVAGQCSGVKEELANVSVSFAPGLRHASAAELVHSWISHDRRRRARGSAQRNERVALCGTEGFI